MPDKKAFFLRGMRDGIPIGLGYFAVAFALGINAAAAGIAPLEAGLMSILNLTSAGEAAAIALLGAGTTYLELAVTQLIINLRYLLMSCSLSQKISTESGIVHRLLIGYGVTDEIFAISSAQKGYLSPYYSYGAIAIAAPMWTLGTILGALGGAVMPKIITSALGVALYAMFLAIILPPARKNRVIGGVVIISMLSSALISLATEVYSIGWLSEGVKIIILTIVISLGAAIFFPVSEESEVAP